MAESPVEESSSSSAEAGPASATGTATATATDGRTKTSKVCGVCGDRAKSYHFGGISCDSCKAFFRRSVQNEAHKNFHCPYEGRCRISISSRKCCQFCRFRKCLAIGMEQSWVMSEEERLQLLRQRMKRKAKSNVEIHDTPTRRLPSSPENPDPDAEEISKYLSRSEVKSIEDVVNLYQQSYREFPFPTTVGQERSEQTYSNVDIIRFFTLTIRRVTQFAQRLESFVRLKPLDQNTLLRTGMVELCAIRGVHAYDAQRDRWPNTDKSLYRDSSYVRAEDISRLVSPEAFEMHMRFTTDLQELQPDEATLMLLLVTVLFSPDRPGLQFRDEVEKQQEHYLLLLRKYMDWHYGPETAAVLYPKILLKLPDLRELNESHTQHSLRLDSEEIAEIQTQLGNLHIVDSDPRGLLPSVLEAALPTYHPTSSTNGNGNKSCLAIAATPTTTTTTTQFHYPTSWYPSSPHSKTPSPFEAFRLGPTPPQSPPYDSDKLNEDFRA